MQIINVALFAFLAIAGTSVAAPLRAVDDGSVGVPMMGRGLDNMLYEGERLAKRAWTRAQEAALRAAEAHLQQLNNQRGQEAHWTPQQRMVFRNQLAEAQEARARLLRQKNA